MKRTRRKPVPNFEPDLSFPPPFSEQAKYLELGDKALAKPPSSSNGSSTRSNPADGNMGSDNVYAIDSSTHFGNTKRAG
jgi:hypothetical protein